MNKQALIEELAEYPDDFEVNISAYLCVNVDNDDYNIVVDRPIIGLACNEETREIRFVVEKSDLRAIDSIDGGMKDLR